MQLSAEELQYLSLLARDYPTIQSARAEIINLTAISNLPKGTEYFLSDIHGEAESFKHILRNASGTIRSRIDEICPELSEEERKTFATLVYYPKEKLEILKKQYPDHVQMYSYYLQLLIRLLKRVSFKFSRSYVRKKLPKDYAYIIEELLYGTADEELGLTQHKKDIIDSIIDNGAADDFIISICTIIPKLAIFKLHILGDMFDRGPDSESVIETLTEYNNVDIQWGNHDMVWMGAAAGNTACIANVIRMCTRYDNLHTLEVGYGISLRPLITFAVSTYANDPCDEFKAMVEKKDDAFNTDTDVLRKIGKAISIIQFKLEGQLIDRHPYYEMSELKMLDKIDYERGTILLSGKEYKLKSKNFPTIDPADPYKLTAEETATVDALKSAFVESPRLQSHIKFLFDRGSFYKTVNGNLLYHGCIPMTEDGEFDPINTSDGSMKGKDWFEYAEKIIRTGFFADKDAQNKTRGIDLFWYIWCGYKSPLFGKKEDRDLRENVSR